MSDFICSNLENSISKLSNGKILIKKFFKVRLKWQNFPRNLQNGNLVQHQATHSNVKSFECQVCNKKYYTKTSLHRHMKIHDDLKSHKCDFCFKNFPNKSQLKRHYRTHTGKNHLLVKYAIKDLQ